MKPPVLLIIFNRFDTAVQVLEKLRLAVVPKLYIFSDGPRKGRVNEQVDLTLVQQKVLAQIDWPCEVFTNFRETNEGPRLAIGRGVSWMFETEEEGIILEHDCVPNSSFFHFCEAMLIRYRNNNQVMHISGDNFQFGEMYGDGSYYFSRITHIWGWATWKRAWEHYDVELKSFPEFLVQTKINAVIPYKAGQKYWLHILQQCYENKVDSWDYQWNYVLLNLDGLSILPNINLVSNVGFDAQALNTTNPKHKTARMETEELQFIIHPSEMKLQHEADRRSILRVVSPSVIRYFWDKLLDVFGFKW
ncbi:MAG: glycosyltransferase family 2 protein [bacterium]|nr:glycosyltransferase family 2 protein [bacterium]